nr:histidine kinase dimerization/phospho-acceptor domain-containing protein [Myxococcota bacterium]
MLDPFGWMVATGAVAGLAGASGTLAWQALRRRRALEPSSPELLEQLGVGVVVCDDSGAVVHSNRFAEALLSLPNLVGRRLEEIERRAVHHPSRSIGIEQSALRHHGEARGTITLLEDQTERAATWRRQEIASRFEALGFLVAGVAHELNNPLAYVRSNLGMLRPLLDELCARADALPLGEESRETL